MGTGIELIATERREQIEKHGRTIDSDVEHNCNNELRDAAIVLISDWPTMMDFPKEWQGPIMQKALDKNYKERLIIAGALIAAEIDRLQAIE